jgi:hypothetical protein
MAYGADAAPEPAPRADPLLARGCEVCLGWGTVITDAGLHELCPGCQTDVRQAESEADLPPTRGGP